MLAACGVMCSQCPAYHAAARGVAFQRRTAAAWRRIYGLTVRPSDLDCGGCLGPDADLFHASRKCAARRCCLGRGLRTCADCPRPACPQLETAQAVWDGVPAIAEVLSADDYARYARAYVGHRERLAAARRGRRGQATE